MFNADLAKLLQWYTELTAEIQQFEYIASTGSRLGAGLLGLPLFRKKLVDGLVPAERAQSPTQQADCSWSVFAQ